MSAKRTWSHSDSRSAAPRGQLRVAGASLNPMRICGRCAAGSLLEALARAPRSLRPRARGSRVLEPLDATRSSGAGGAFSGRRRRCSPSGPRRLRRRCRRSRPRLGRGGDAAEAEREVVRVGGLAQRLVVGDQARLDAAPSATGRRSASRRLVALGDGVVDLLGAVLVLDAARGRGAVVTRTSTAGTRPLPSARGTRRWEMTRLEDRRRAGAAPASAGRAGTPR